MYLFVRGDLSTAQQIVQTSHAAACIGQRFHSDTNIVLCECPNEDRLNSIAEYLNEQNIEFELFFEPDIDSHTALATQPLAGKARAPMRRFRLMK